MRCLGRLKGDVLLQSPHTRVLSGGQRVCLRAVRNLGKFDPGLYVPSMLSYKAKQSTAKFFTLLKYLITAHIGMRPK